MARNYSIYEAKARLSGLLRIVKQGYAVTVSERGKPIAKIIPFENAESIYQKLNSMEENGLLIRGRKKTFPRGHKIKGALKRFLKDR